MALWTVPVETLNCPHTYLVIIPKAVWRCDRSGSHVASSIWCVTVLFSNVCVYACMHGYVCKYVGIYVCMYVHIYVPMYICTYVCIHGCMDTFLLDVCSCRRWVWLRLLPPNVRQVCGDKSPPSLPRPSFLFHLLISVLNTSDGLGGYMTHSGCSSSL